MQSRWPHPKERFLIIDIGGGSAEIILSDDDRIASGVFEAAGRLRLQEIVSADGSAARLRAASPRGVHRGAHRVRAVRRIGSTHIDRVIGTSATASAVVCAVNRIPRPRRDEADRQRATTAQIRKLYRDVCVLDTRRAPESITGIGPRRAEIIIPGTAVLLRVLEAFNMPALFYSAAGVRDGIIADLAARGVGREQRQLSADQRTVVEQMAEHYGVRLRHARKVARLATDLFHRLSGRPPAARPLWPAARSRRLPARRRALRQRYAAITSTPTTWWPIPTCRDSRGLSARVIANLCRYHRKAAPAPEHPNLQLLDAEGRRAVGLLMPLLRLADSLDRSHDQRIRSLECKVRENDLLVILNVPPETDIDLELWAVERLLDMFKAVYGRSLTVART